jgi:hypothetical protein
MSNILKKFGKGLYTGLKIILVLIGILFLVGMYAKRSKAEPTNFYSVTTSLTSATQIRTVTMFATVGRSECEAIVTGTRDALKKASGEMVLEAAKCFDAPPLEYANAFRNKPIDNVIYIAYRKEAWPVRVLFYGVRKEQFTQATCKALISAYAASDPKASCVYSNS